ncbi:GTP 3',8-cyclase MoaA [Sphingobacterium sp. lm-10]|uniref:GTP 3',8-cyclase MoaA n=1 Tax=Sphingobacterium sp. lm-10 TaxID=2944904 RepID=UPI0020225C5C|nr:GTP 3',8-cyclase MoaA [Sphingobacterium sp. lm-10]MCL7986658.1 GTP 3',8-cyclase MoaA [Sphingobacterium sp. lm-10]
MLVDQFGRQHTYLRISLTDNCNLRCFYCMPEEDYSFAPRAQLMQPAEIDFLARRFIDLGVNKIRLTGGEPFVRKDADLIMAGLAQLPVELACTTNGIRIDDLLPEIQACNFSSMNVSLDTLKRDKFLQITRRDLFDRVYNNIDLLLQEGIPCKINMVVMKGLNDDELVDFMALTKDHPIEVRFIEFMPFSGNKWTSNQVLTHAEILDSLDIDPELHLMPGSPHDTAKRYKIPGYRGNIAVISSMSEPFCSGCNRIRLTADGKLKNCLFSDSEVDLLTPLRTGEDPVPLIKAHIYKKKAKLGGQMTQDFNDLEAEKLSNRSMIRIGG